MTRARHPINRDLITERMNQLGYTERSVIRDADQKPNAFRTARREGWIPGSTTLNELHNLADHLAVSIGDLLDETPPTNKPTRDEANSDAEAVIPILIALKNAIPATNLAKGFDWDRQRLHACLAAIPANLTGTGMRYLENQGNIRIIATYVTDEETLRNIRRVRTMNYQLNSTEATLLTKLINGTNVQDRMSSNATKTSLGALKNLGLIALDDNAIYQPTNTIRLALPDL
ncbi:MAG: hypothetical protein FWD95_04125 [Nocardioidaceae bacterium]|nr:hypothetical protein [Nocardioidaceae bacterium]